MAGTGSCAALCWPKPQPRLIGWPPVRKRMLVCCRYARMRGVLLGAGHSQCPTRRAIGNVPLMQAPFMCSVHSRLRKLRPMVKRGADMALHTNKEVKHGHAQGERTKPQL